MEVIIIAAVAKKVLSSLAIGAVIKAITKQVRREPYNKYPIEDSINQEKEKNYGKEYSDGNKQEDPERTGKERRAGGLAKGGCALGAGTPGTRQVGH